MGNSNSRKLPPVIQECRAPVYCVKKIGCRHLILAGGGGAANTGVANQIETHLIHFDKSPPPGSETALRAKLCTTVKTGKHATMNMDVVSVSPPEQGKYIIATGHDQFCDIYETTGFTVASPEEGAEENLTFNFREVGRITTDDKQDTPYQKCVRFDKATGGKRMATGGADGHVRIWNVHDIVTNRDPTIERRPITDIAAHDGDVDDIDISPDGRILISVGYDGHSYLWDMETGKKMMELPTPIELAKGYKARSVRFTPLGGNNVIFVAAYNPVQRTSKSTAFLALWAFNRERQVCRPVVVKEFCKGDAISNLCVSADGNLTGVGTMQGTVCIVDTHEMRPLHWARETHGIFVTGLEFLDRRASDLGAPAGVALPGPAADCRASLVSLSADQTVQVHHLPFTAAPSTSLFLLKLSILSLFIYYLVWTLSGW